MYSFDGSFQPLHADVGNLKFLGKSASDPKYCLMLVDLFTSMAYVYPTKSRKSIASKMEFFYREVKPKRKGQKRKLETDQEFKERKVNEIKNEYNMDMLLTAVTGGKAFAAEQKLRELKKRIFRFKALKKKVLKRISPYEIIK